MAFETVGPVPGGLADAANAVVGAGKAVLDTVGKFFDIDAPDFDRMNMMPKPRVLSSQHFLILQPATVTEGFIEPINIGEIDNFTAEKNFTIVKRWKPFGSKFEKLLIEDNGWDISFSAGKVNWGLAYLVYAQELLLAGKNNDQRPSASNSFEGVEIFYTKPIFSIESKIRHYDKTLETYLYEDVQITKFSQETSPDNAEIKESVSAFSPFRTLLALDNDKKNKINDSIGQIIAGMILSNRS